MKPNYKVHVSANGDSKIEGLEKTDTCSKLTDLGKAAGKVTSVVDKDHQPVKQTVHTGGSK